jgi:hypothetical protein
MSAGQPSDDVLRQLSLPLADSLHNSFGLSLTAYAKSISICCQRLFEDCLRSLPG